MKPNLPRGDEFTAEQKQRLLAGQGTWYQQVEIDGALSPANPQWAESRFYNRGKWESFILPLLPPVKGAFAELGSNAGLFLLYAAEMGYDQVIGIEGDDTTFAQSRLLIGQYRARDPGTYGRIGLLNARVGEPGYGATNSCNIDATCRELDVESLPRLEVMLMANVLYWIEREACFEFIAALARKSRYAIVVGLEASSHLGGPGPISEVREAFSKDWRERACVPGIDGQSDPAPRRMFSIVFESNALDGDG